MGSSSPNGIRSSGKGTSLQNKNPNSKAIHTYFNHGTDKMGNKSSLSIFNF